MTMEEFSVGIDAIADDGDEYVVERLLESLPLSGAMGAITYGEPPEIGARFHVRADGIEEAIVAAVSMFHDAASMIGLIIDRIVEIDAMTIDRLAEMVMTRDELDEAVQKMLSSIGASLDELREEAKTGKFRSEEARLTWTAIRGIVGMDG